MQILCTFVSIFKILRNLSLLRGGAPNGATPNIQWFLFLGVTYARISHFPEILISINFNSTVVSQFYESQVSDEYVIKGNAAVLKCNIPSFVSDHVEVIAWVDTTGIEYLREDSSGIFHFFYNFHPSSLLSFIPKIANLVDFYQANNLL